MKPGDEFHFANIKVTRPRDRFGGLFSSPPRYRIWVESGPGEDGYVLADAVHSDRELLHAFSGWDEAQKAIIVYIL
jgi:hypothetical protein